jgi:hypothetical protein
MNFWLYKINIDKPTRPHQKEKELIRSAPSKNGRLLHTDKRLQNSGFKRPNNVE